MGSHESRMMKQPSLATRTRYDETTTTTRLRAAGRRQQGGRALACRRFFFLVSILRSQSTFFVFALFPPLSHRDESRVAGVGKVKASRARYSVR